MLLLHLNYPINRKQRQFWCDSLLDLVSRGWFAVHFTLTDETLPSLRTMSIYCCVDRFLSEILKEKTGWPPEPRNSMLNWFQISIKHLYELPCYLAMERKSKTVIQRRDSPNSSRRVKWLQSYWKQFTNRNIRTFIVTSIEIFMGESIGECDFDIKINMTFIFEHPLCKKSLWGWRVKSRPTE